MVQEGKMNALDTYLKANGGLERKVIVTLLPRQVTHVGMFESSTETVEFDRLRVWADPDLDESFKKIPGVMTVNHDKTAPVCYSISVDPRYNVQWVMAEIEAAAKLHEPKQSEPAPDPDSLYYPAGWRPGFISGDTTNT
jgi:hypothetical protein